MKWYQFIVACTLCLQACQSVPTSTSNVSFEAEFTQRQKLSEVRERLKAEFADVYAGMYIQGGDPFYPLVFMTKIDTDRIDNAKFGLDFGIELADHSLSFLENIRDEFSAWLDSIDYGDYLFGINERTNTLELNIDDVPRVPAIGGRGRFRHSFICRTQRGRTRSGNDAPSG